jgi:alpha-tubulin suppressor-like RCC1 family protein
MHTKEQSRRTRRMAIVATGLAAGSIAAFAVPASASAAAQAPKPTISTVFNNNFHVPSGSNGGGPTITVKGSHFVNVQKVLFGSTPGTHIHRLSQHKLTVTLPAHPAGRVDVRVVTGAGKSNINPHDKFYFQVRHRLDGGYYHSCQALGTGIGRCWGYNAYGEIGDGTNTDRHTPAQVSGLSKVVSVATGYYHSCALLAGGNVKCWGYNGYGQLGNNTTTNSNTPVQVLNLGGPAVAISAGPYDSCATLATGKVKCWGYNGYGQLGNNSTTNSSIPVQVHNLSNAVDIGAGYGHTCATKRNGSESCWGYNLYGQLGNGTTSDSLVPVPVSGVNHATATALGDYTSCVITAAQKVSCWGYGADGERGDGTTVATKTHAGNVSGLSNVTKLGYGGYQGCVVVASGNALCWGYNAYGEVGNGTTNSPQTTATAVAGLHNAVDIGGGTYHSLALLKNGTTKAWGYNGTGQLGNGTTTNSSTPVTVS